jgi:hypothetical protein
MLAQDEKIKIRSLINSEEQLTTPLRAKLLESLNNGEPSIFEEPGDYLCCDLGIDQPDRYQWITFEDCRALGGRAADNSECGH